MKNKQIRIFSEVEIPVEKVWEFWTTPKHILKWNHASDEWHTTKAENNLRSGGKFNSRMEAKDGSMGFDFTGKYITVDTHNRIVYRLDDGRKVIINYISSSENTGVEIIFEAEQTNTPEMQEKGWQAILDNFKKYAEQA